MKKGLILTLLLGLLMSSATIAQTVRRLPAPNMKASKTSVLKALQQRKSVREFSDRAISDETLSTVLWAACGVNRKDGDKVRITAPSALNAQDIMVYVCGANGTFLYEPKDNALREITKADIRSLIAGRQASVATAPYILLLVSDTSKFPVESESLPWLDGGYVSENICLACSALGLATVPRASMEVDVIKSALSLTDKQIPVLNNPIGWPKK